MVTIKKQSSKQKEHKNLNQHFSNGTASNLGKLDHFRVLGENVFNIETASVTHNDLVNLHQHFSLE